MTELGGDLLASRTKGTLRQLFGGCDELDGDQHQDDFLIRPGATRRQNELAAAMGDPQHFGAAAINLPGNVPVARVSPSTCTASAFQERFMQGDGKQIPCMIESAARPHPGCWPAGEKHWGSVALQESLGLGFRCELKDSSATCLLEDFLKYCGSSSCATDDNPCYLWETLVTGDPRHDFLISKFSSPPMLRSLRSPETNAEAAGDVEAGSIDQYLHSIHEPGDLADLFSCAGEDGLEFGLHRWMLIGPPRSGSGLHVDPLGTSAWNTLLLGTKLWAVLPPVEAGRDGNGDDDNVNNDGDGDGVNEEVEEGTEDAGMCACKWFKEELPLLFAASTEAALTQASNSAAPSTARPPPQPQCFLQHEGETIYMPAGWRHAVLNLSQTVCVTQNWAEPLNYSLVAREVYGEEAFSHEEKDSWRLKVRSCGMSGGDAEALCVHCSRHAEGNFFELYSDRPVCLRCEKTRSEYDLCSAAEAEALGVCMRRLVNVDRPPSVVKVGRGQCFLRAHVLQAKASCAYACVSVSSSGKGGSTARERERTKASVTAGGAGNRSGRDVVKGSRHKDDSDRRGHDRSRR